MDDLTLERKINEQLQKRFCVKEYAITENVVGENLSAGMGKAVLYVNAFNRMQLVFHTQRRFHPIIFACSIKRKELLRLVNEILTTQA